jgi:hypothetical protein
VALQEVVVEQVTPEAAMPPKDTDVAPLPPVVENPVPFKVMLLPPVPGPLEDEREVKSSGPLIDGVVPSRTLPEVSTAAQNDAVAHDTEFGEALVSILCGADQLVPL